MSAGYHGEGKAPGIKMGQVIRWRPPGQNIRTSTTSSLKCPYGASRRRVLVLVAPPHIASMCCAA